jgi:hypothetical protein
VRNFLFGRYPAMFIGVAIAVLTLADGLGLHQFGPTTVAAIAVALNLVLGALQAYYTRPIVPAVIVNAVGAVAAVAAAFGFHTSPQLIGGVDAVLVAVLSVMVHGQVAPMLAIRNARHAAETPPLALHERR